MPFTFGLSQNGTSLTMGVGVSRQSDMPRQQHLKNVGIRPRTLALYRFEVSQFFSYLKAFGLPLASSFLQLDSQLADYINHLFQEGEAISRAGWLLSGMRRFYPRVRRELAVSQQWYLNWTRTHTPERATPITWRIIRGDISLCLHEKWGHLGATLLLGFVFMLRTQEMLQLETDDILVVHDTITIRLSATKTSRQFEQSLTFSDPTVVGILRKLMSMFTSHQLWPFSATHFRSCFRALHNFFGLQELHLVPYSIRRGAATHFYQFYNSLDYVLVQGRWKDQRTARIYLDDARATVVRFQAAYTSSPKLNLFLREWKRYAVGYARG